jgi:hypothetical protein
MKFTLNPDQESLVPLVTPGGLVVPGEAGKIR